MNRFASIRFDHTLDEHDRAVATHALVSREANPTSWATAGGRTYARVEHADGWNVSLPRELRARIDVPALAVLRVRPQACDRLGALAVALLGADRPHAVIDGCATAEEVIVELQPTGAAVRLLLGLIDETLGASTGRTVVPVLPLADAVLAEYAALRLREADLTFARVLDAYVEDYARRPEARA